MGWRSIMINQPATLRRENFALKVEQTETAKVPFEDIAVIVLNHKEILITHPVLSACADYGIALFCTGNNHQPSGVMLPFQQHSRATKVLRLQLSIDKPTCKQIWTKVIQAKINNQATCLTLCKVTGADRLTSYARRVRSGDSDNLEAQASAFYFPQLFGSTFFRGEEIWVNAALNYGYSILRGACARALVAHGFLPTIGIFHSSEQNAFNLADDLIEVFRPLVDLYVFKTYQQQPELLLQQRQELSPLDKAGLVALLNIDMQMPTGKMNVLNAIEQATEALYRVLDGADTDDLELPSLSGLQIHQTDG